MKQLKLQLKKRSDCAWKEKGAEYVQAPLCRRQCHASHFNWGYTYYCYNCNNIASSDQYCNTIASSEQKGAEYAQAPLCPQGPGECMSLPAHCNAISSFVLHSPTFALGCFELHYFALH